MCPVSDERKDEPEYGLEYAATPCDEDLEDEYCEVHDEFGCRFGVEV